MALYKYVYDMIWYDHVHRQRHTPTKYHLHYTSAMHVVINYNALKLLLPLLPTQWIVRWTCSLLTLRHQSVLFLHYITLNCAICMVKWMTRMKTQSTKTGLLLLARSWCSTHHVQNWPTGVFCDTGCTKIIFQITAKYLCNKPNRYYFS